MAKLFVAGQSGNPSGRPKHSVRTVRGMVERFVKRNITPTRLTKIFNQLSAKDQAELLLQLLPYSLAKVSPEAISQEEIEQLYSKLEQRVKDHAKAI